MLVNATHTITLPAPSLCTLRGRDDHFCRDVQRGIVESRSGRKRQAADSPALLRSAKKKTWARTAAVAHRRTITWDRPHTNIVGETGLFDPDCRSWHSVIRRATPGVDLHHSNAHHRHRAAWQTSPILRPGDAGTRIGPGGTECSSKRFRLDSQFVALHRRYGSADQTAVPFILALSNAAGHAVAASNARSSSVPESTSCRRPRGCGRIASGDGHYADR